MTKLLIASACCLLLAALVYAQVASNGSFSGTIGTTPFNGTFTISSADKCSDSGNAKASAVVSGTGGPAEIVPGVVGKSIFVCGFALGNWGGANKFSHGTTTQCLSQTGTLLTGNLLAQGQSPVVVGNTNQTILAIPSGDSLCNDNGAQGFVTYVQK